MSEIKILDLEAQAKARKVEDYDERELKTVRYLKFLDADAADCGRPDWKYIWNDVNPLGVTNADSCIDCLVHLINYEVWPGHLFGNKCWGIYLRSISEESAHAAITMLLEAGGPADLLVFFRACYRFGRPVIDDQEWDALERLYLQCYPALQALNNVTQEDDEYNVIVTNAIRMSGLKASKETNTRISSEQGGVYASLNSEKSTSVRPVRSYEEAYEYLKAAPSCDTHWSLKVDGVNTKLMFSEDCSGLDIALSRGRASDSWDFTEAVRRLLTYHGCDVSKLAGKVTGESIVDPAALEGLRLKYPGKEYKSPKSTAVAMLRAPQQFAPEDYEHLHLYAFEYGELSKREAFKVLSEAGLRTPPAITVAAGKIPLDSLEEFQAWLDTTVLDPLWEQGKQSSIGSDGVVLQLLTAVENDRADKYSDLNIALKFSHWTEQDYKSKVLDILFEQRRVEMSVVLVVEPVTTRDLNVATRVSVGSPAILVKDNVRIGDTISFTRKSEAINVYTGKVE